MTDDTQDTMRTKVLDAQLALFPERGTEEGQVFEDTYGLGFSISTREPLGLLPKGKLSSLGIYGGQGERKQVYPHWDVVIPCVAEVHVSKEANEKLAKTVERYLGVVERALRANETLGGLVATIEVTGENVDIDSPYAGQADGALYFNVRFFQAMQDPRKGR